MDRRFEQGLNGEGVEGVPQDLLINPAKYDADIPQWRRTVGLVKHYGTTRPNKRDVFFDQTVAPFVKEPTLFKQLFENLNLVSQLKPEVNIDEIKAGLVTHAEAAVSKRASLAGWTPKKIEQLIILGLNSSGEFKGVVEKMQAALFNSPKTIEEAVDLFYNAAFAMVETEDSDVREELFSIHCLEKSWLNETAESVSFLEMGLFSADDSHLGKYSAYGHALEAVGKLVEIKSFPSIDLSLIDPYQLESRRLESRYQRHHQYDIHEWRTSDKPQKFIDQVLRKNPERYQKIIAYIESPDFDYKKDEARATESMSLWEAGYRKMEEFRNASWPANVMKNPDDPLRRLMRERLNILILKTTWEQQKITFLQKGYRIVTPRYLQIGDFLLDILAQDCYTTEQKNQVIREIHSDLATHEVTPSQILKDSKGDLTPPELEEILKLHAGSINTYGEDGKIVFALLRAMPAEITGRLAAVLEFHRPLMTMEQVKIIDQKLQEIKFNIMTDFRKSVGKRGYRLSVADPMLRQLGYQAISFRQEGNNVTVNIDIDKQTFQFGIDSNYRIISGEDIKRFQSPQDRAWLELLVLSHLKKLMCTEEEEKEFKEDLVAGEKQYEIFKRQVAARSEHPRRLPPNQHFSSEAYTKCLRGHLPIKDLLELNRMKALIGKGGTLESGLWTYVSGIEWVDTSELKPIKVAFKNATEDLRSVLKLGALSSEELSRIEDEILGELEKN